MGYKRVGRATLKKPEVMDQMMGLSNLGANSLTGLAKQNLTIGLKARSGFLRINRPGQSNNNISNPSGGFPDALIPYPVNKIFGPLIALNQNSTQFIPNMTIDPSNQNIIQYSYPYFFNGNFKLDLSNKIQDISGNLYDPSGNNYQIKVILVGSGGASYIDMDNKKDALVIGGAGGQVLHISDVGSNFQEKLVSGKTFYVKAAENFGYETSTNSLSINNYSSIALDPDYNNIFFSAAPASGFDLSFNTMSYNINDINVNLDETLSGYPFGNSSSLLPFSPYESLQNNIVLTENGVTGMSYAHGGFQYFYNENIHGYVGGNSGWPYNNFAVNGFTARNQYLQFKGNAGYVPISNQDIMDLSGNYNSIVSGQPGRVIVKVIVVKNNTFPNNQVPGFSIPNPNFDYNSSQSYAGGFAYNDDINNGLYPES
jgi:hypothetical protein